MAFRCSGLRAQPRHEARKPFRPLEARPSGPLSPATPGYARQATRSRPSPPSTQARDGRSPFPTERLRESAAKSKQHEAEGCRPRSRPERRRVTVKLRRPEAQWQRHAKLRIANDKASCEPGGFGSPAAPGYTRKRCQKPPQPPKHPGLNLRKPVADRAPLSQRSHVETAGGRGLSPRVHDPIGDV